ncbi:hypothetical protein GTA08_BOTSDO10774 [Neofusicoccum parvum]|uniref:Uncharacterized protein n=1 Tax=Neofusicoccum parvum TaxID=310453 RepID=A0ACB5SDQ9_9PEZI|nr:hypothetical protein GTA08_BOTSDO10774 [Neofusicoccum parvum]
MCEDALKAGQKLLRQDREAFEKEKRQFHDEQQQRRTRDDENRKRQTQKRSRSKSKPRGKVIPDDSWRRDDHKSKQQQQQQNERHTSWSSINTSASTPSRYPSDSESTTTATTATTASTFSKPRHPPTTQDDDDDEAELTWTSAPTAFRAAYARYTAAWAALPPHSPLIPYPSPTHAAAQLRQTSHLPLSAQHGWSTDAVVKYNAVHFFLAAHGVPVAPDVGAARPKVGLRGVVGDGDAGMKSLVREVRRELRRWHEDGLKWRGGEEGTVNEQLVGDETARAVFRAFTELRDGLLAEMRWRREKEAAAAAAVTTGGDGGGGGGGGEAKGKDQGQGYGWTGMDWTVLSEAIL